MNVCRRIRPIGPSTVIMALYVVHCTVIMALYVVHYTVYSVHCTLYSVQCIVYNKHNVNDGIII